MLTGNPFRQKLDRKAAKVKTTVWSANNQGKDASVGKTDFAFSDQFLWIAWDFSIPLAWIVSVDIIGPGFQVVWDNPIDNHKEAAVFCIRTMFGYNTKDRDDLVQKLREAVAHAEAMPLPTVAAAAATSGTCQRCGVQQALTYDFEWFISVLMYWIKKPSRSVLCRDHAKLRLLLVVVTNFFLGNLGIGIVMSPIINLANVGEARNKGAIGSGMARALMTIGFLPYLLPVALVAWVVYYAVTF